MPERLKEILQRVMDWWNQYTTRQKTIIVGAGAAFVFTLAIIIYVSSQPKYVSLVNCETPARAAEVEELLKGAGIRYKASANALNFEVEESQYNTAIWALAAAGIPADEYTLEKALSGGMSVTASDKEKLSAQAYESKLEKTLSSFENVKSAIVHLNIAPQNGTLIAQKRESSAFIKLELDGTFTSANAANVAKAVAGWLGNETTSNITILDSNSNLLYAGGDDYSTAGIASSMQELQNQGQSMVSNQVKNVFFATNQFSQVEVTCSLDMDFASYEEAVKEYTPADGQEQGLLAHRETYEAENQNSGSYVPGTDSNDENVYVSPDANNSSSTQAEKLEDFLPNEYSKYGTIPAGTINYGSSAMTVALIRYREIREEDVKRQGLLDGGLTWEEYKLQNSNDVKLEVDADYYNMAHTATRIPVDNITIVSYESPIFIDKEAMKIDWTNVMSAVVLIVILALLALVILRSMSGRRQVAQEEELSVENLLQSTPEAELEDIDVETKSETRKMIEKFVDENPEAAAALLRNWLSEDW